MILTEQVVDDTTPEARAFLTNVYREMSMQQKWEILRRMYRTGKRLAEGGLRMNRPDATEQEVVDHWLSQILPRSTCDELRRFRHG